MSATIRSAQRAIDKLGVPLEIVRGEGYHYFIYDTLRHYETVSVYIPYTSHQTPLQWAEIALNIWADIKEKIA